MGSDRYKSHLVWKARIWARSPRRTFPFCVPLVPSPRLFAKTLSFPSRALLQVLAPLQIRCDSYTARDSTFFPHALLVEQVQPALVRRKLCLAAVSAISANG